MKTIKIFAILPLLGVYLGCGSGPRSEERGDAGGDAPGVLVDAGPADGSPSDGAMDAEGMVDGPTRTLTTRSLYATDVQSLLLDPFATGDTSWGHFTAFLRGATDSNVVLTRIWMSDSPVGMSIPVVRVSPMASDGGTADAGAPVLHIPTALTGSNAPVSAQVWVSVATASGTAAAFADHASALQVYLAANEDLPTIPAPVTKYVASSTPAQTVTIAGREWDLVGLTMPTPFAEGGFFVIIVSDPTLTWLLAAPQVTAGTTAIHPIRGRLQPLTLEDQEILRAYREHVRRHVPRLRER
jgi:hypothetical protein